MILERFGWFIVRWHRRILLASLVGVSGSVALVADLNDRMKLELFVAPHTDAHEGKRVLEEEFGVGVSNLLLLITAK